MGPHFAVAGEGCNSVCIASVASLSAQRSAFAARAAAGEGTHWMRGQLTDCTLRSVCVRDFSSTFFPSTLEPNRAKGGWQQRNVLHSNFLQKKLHFLPLLLFSLLLCCFSCAVACQSGSEGQMCVHSAVEHCSVWWLLPQGWGRKADRGRGWS